MITQYFKSGTVATFTENGLSLDNGDGSESWLLTKEEFAEFMPLAMHIYHQSMPQYPPPYGSMGGNEIKPAKKRGRPAKNATTAKRGRQRKA